MTECVSACVGVCVCGYLCVGLCMCVCVWGGGGACVRAHDFVHVYVCMCV